MIYRSYFSLAKKLQRPSSSIDNTLYRVRIIFYTLSLVSIIAIAIYNKDSIATMLDNPYSPILYFFMGVIAAIIANSTGAGGGIVFLPIFISLGLSPEESLSTSIAIQCFGMTSGALTWLLYRKQEVSKTTNSWQQFYPILLISSVCSCTSLLFSQYWIPKSPIDIGLLFSIFSLVVGSTILIKTLKGKTPPERTSALSQQEITGLVLVSIAGGAITSWLSIGIGEIILLYLLFMRFRLEVSVAIAVCVSAINVLVAIPYYAFSDVIGLSVLIFAAPGAMIGGTLARSFATTIGTYKLKIAASSWIIISAIPHLTLFN